MNKPTFLEGVAVALAASILGSITYFMLQVLLTEDAAIRWLTALLTLLYLFYLLTRSNERTGRLTVMAVWLATTVTLGLTSPSPVLFVTEQTLTIWLIRSLFYYSSLLPAAIDFALCIFSVATAFWVGQHTASLWLTLWCYFLVQALFPAIPAGRSSNGETPNFHPDDAFLHAHRLAEAAIRKLSSHS